MDKQGIFEGNWREGLYENGPYLAYLSLGAAPAENEAGLEWLYFLLVTDREHQELSSREFKSLSKALEALNKQYGHWELGTRSEHKEGDGCSSCQAH